MSIQYVPTLNGVELRPQSLGYLRPKALGDLGFDPITLSAVGAGASTLLSVLGPVADKFIPGATGQQAAQSFAAYEQQINADDAARERTKLYIWGGLGVVALGLGLAFVLKK